MQPLDEFYYFAKVIEHGGFASAARAIGIPKSRLSRHVSSLERRLGVRLMNRSTRKFVITELGHEVHRHAVAMLAEADAAVEAVEFARAEPRGLIKLSCPVALAQTVLSQLLPDFFARYPNIRLLVFATNRRVDVLNEGLDAAVRVRTHPSGEDGLVMRTFGESSERLVTSPAYLERAGVPLHPTDLVSHQTLGFAPENERQTWELRSVGGEIARVDLSPRLVCHDFIVLKAAVLAGLGIAFLPHNVVAAELEAGRLRSALPEWSLPMGVVHVVFPTRRGLLPSVRALIDFLAERLPPLL